MEIWQRLLDWKLVPFGDFKDRRESVRLKTDRLKLVGPFIVSVQWG